MDLDKLQSGRLDMDISSDREIAMRTEGYPADAVATGLGVAIILIGLGAGWAISKTRGLIGKRS